MKDRNWFENKKCNYCGQPGSIYRWINNKGFILCSSRECNKINLVKMGFFGTSLKIKGE